MPLSDEYTANGEAVSPLAADIPATVTPLPQDEEGTVTEVCAPLASDMPSELTEGDEPSEIAVDDVSSEITEDDVPSEIAEGDVPSELTASSTPDGPSPTPAREEPVRAVHNAFSLIEMITLTLVVVLLFTMFFFRLSVVDGASMEDTLYDGDRLILLAAFYQPKVGDIIVFEDYSTKHKRPLVKRIIATEGQTVTVLSNTKVLVDGVLVTGGYVDGVSHEYTYPMEPVTVSEGCVFVMGDHRNNSTDSRSFGEISVDSILGKVIYRVYPFEAVGTPDALPSAE